MKKEPIDYEWVNSIKSAFYRILENIDINEKLNKSKVF